MGGEYAITNNTFQILWDGVTDASLTHYTIQERVGVSGSWQVPDQVPDNGNIPSADASTGDLTRDYGKNYFFRVKSCGTEGGAEVCGPWSSVSKLLLRLPPPANFSTSSTTSYSGNYSLSWSAGTPSAGTSSASSVDRYEIEESTGGGNNGSATALTFSSALGKTYAKTIGTYSYRIRSCVAGSLVPNITCSAWSSTRLLVTVDPLPKVINVVSNATNGVSSDASYEISWDTVTDASEYEITESIGGGAQTPSSTVTVPMTSETYRNKVYGKIYSYTVKACAGNNCGMVVSDPVSVEVKLSTPSVNAITASHSGQYTVDWPNVTNANSYDWQEAPGNSPSASDWSVEMPTAAGVNSFEQVGKSSGSVFSYRVRACRDTSNTQLVRACGEYSTVQDVTVPALSGSVTLSDDQSREEDAVYTLTRADTLSAPMGGGVFRINSRLGPMIAKMNALTSQQNPVIRNQMR